MRLSVCRIAALEGATVRRLPRDAWASGDYVVGRVMGPSHPPQVELENGRMATIDRDDLVVGAWGTRAATLEATGSWEGIGEDGRFEVLTAAGLFGRLTSQSPFSPELAQARYEGHLLLQGDKATMARAVQSAAEGTFGVPTVLIVGSSMSSGKTASATLIVRRLCAMGLRVVAAKLTGAGRYRDVLAMKDGGACAIFDFVDAGLPSTVCSEGQYRQAILPLLARMGALDADVAVVEAGASPLEPYNGQACVDMLGDQVRFTLLCASDPYAALGIREAFGTRIDLVAGIAANTNAGRALIERLTGLPALQLRDPSTRPVLDRLLVEALTSLGPS